MGFPTWKEARDDAQRRADHWRMPAVVVRLGGQHGYPLTWESRLTSWQDLHELSTCEVVTPAVIVGGIAWRLS